MKEQPKEGGRYTRTKSTGRLKQVQKPTASPEQATAKPQAQAADQEASNTSDAQTEEGK